VYLDDNKISGAIPGAIGNLPFLEFLGLSNMLDGPIPSEIFQLQALSEIDLSYNQINGGIPDTLSNITGLDHLILWNNRISGEIPKSIGAAKQLSYIDIS
jgi:Leucine-rich repeat (LRR) protein